MKDILRKLNSFHYFVWSSGLEIWEPCTLTLEEVKELEYVCSKSMRGESHPTGLVNVYMDTLGRYLAKEIDF
jgi:hypothetical protein